MNSIKSTFEKEFTLSATFKTKPKGIILFDSFNNEWFPLDIVQIDSRIFSTRLIKDELHRKYGGSRSDLFLPWHYTVEFIGKDYFALNSRPLMYKSLIPGFENYICVCVVGDTKTDLYTDQLYKIIAANVLNSLRYLPGWRLQPKELKYKNIYENFDRKKLERLLK